MGAVTARRRPASVPVRRSISGCSLRPAAGWPRRVQPALLPGLGSPDFGSGSMPARPFYASLREAPLRSRLPCSNDILDALDIAFRLGGAVTGTMPRLRLT